MGPLEGQEEAPSAFHSPVGIQVWISRVSSATGWKHSKDQPPPPACAGKAENKTKNPFT